MSKYTKDGSDFVSEVSDLLYELLDVILFEEEPNRAVEIESQIISDLHEHYEFFIPEFQTVFDEINRTIDNENDHEADYEQLEDGIIELANKIQKTNVNIFEYMPDVLEDHRSEYNTRQMNTLHFPSIAEQQLLIQDGEAFVEEISEEEVRKRVTRLRVASEEVYDTICQSARPISRDVLLSNIEHCSDRAIALAASRKGILNYHGEYVCIDKLLLSEKDVACLRAEVLCLCDDFEVHHIEELFEILQTRQEDILMRAYVQNSYQLFSLISELYPFRFSYYRPYFAENNVRISTPKERLEHYLRGKKEVAISDFIGYAKQKYIKVNSILELINSLNDRVLLKNREVLIDTREIGLTSSIVADVIGEILQEVRNTTVVAIRDLECVTRFPRINIPWDEWLIYSIITKWGQRLHVFTTSNQFKMSIPVVSYRASVPTELIASIAQKYSDDRFSPPKNTVDNLDDLDDLIADYIDMDLDWSVDDL